MVKLIWFFLMGSILGFVFIANIFNATGLAMETIRAWFDSNNLFYNLVSQLFIISTHPIMQLFLAFGIILIAIRVIFSFA